MKNFLIVWSITLHALMKPSFEKREKEWHVDIRHHGSYVINQNFALIKREKISMNLGETMTE